jgi:hypothetical protein
MIKWPIEIKQNKYSRWYDVLISRAQNRTLDKNVYVEKHHIVPYSFTKDNSDSNLVSLTAKEHYIAHALLWKINFPIRYHEKMSFALRMMIFGAGTKKQMRNYKCHSRIYESIRIEFSKNHSRNMSGENNPFYGKKHSPETMQKIMDTKQKNGTTGGAKKGNIVSAETRAKISKSNKGKTWDKLFTPEELAIRKAKRSAETKKNNTGKKLSEETKKKIAEKATGRPSPFKGMKGIRTAPDGAAAKRIATMKLNGTFVSAAQKRIATMKKNGTFRGSLFPLIYRGIEYRNFGEVCRKFNKSKSRIKTEIKHWGDNPDLETMQAIDSGRLKPTPVNKGVPMSKEQKIKLSQRKLAKFQAMRDAGVPLPNTGRICSEETKIKIRNAKLTNQMQKNK